MKVLLVTNVNIASNPRCHKEVMALTNAGHQVSVLKFNTNNWSVSFEKEIEANYPGVNWIKLPDKSQNLFIWVVASIVQLYSKYFVRAGIRTAKNIACYLDKRSYMLNRKLRQITTQYDLVIAHNPGTFWPVSNYALKKHVKYAIDVEDYHPGEYQDVHTERCMRMLMQQTLNNAVYVSCASPLIAQHTAKDIGTADKVHTINNVFPKTLQPLFKNRETTVDSLRLVWFSQYIGLDRGLDDIIEAMNVLHDFSITLTLIGYANDTVQQMINEQLKNKKHNIVIKSAMPEKELLEEVSLHDVGLALEKSPNLNRRLCLTNKLFTYLLCGNAIIASDTEAQKTFLSQYTGVGKVYNSGDITQLAALLSDFYNNQETLYKYRSASYTLASATMNWDIEQHKFLALVSKAGE
ncbi:hypothetical protein CAP35_02520 [Chitinophagaceae bacterium IBVUCB1]|nr:hypothetical protein CAP35_02520 [Chitinophagaceae bacterium IBVUCB1]